MNKNFESELQEYLDMWDQDIAPDFVVEEFAVKKLSAMDTNDYSIKLLPEKLLNLIITEGEAQLSCHLRGGNLTQLRGGEIITLGFMVPHYKKLFEKWSIKGWIKLEKVTTENIEGVKVQLLV